MGWLSDLIGGKTQEDAKSYGETTGYTDVVSNENTTESLLRDLISKATSRTSGTETKGGPETQRLIQQLIPAVGKYLKNFSKNAAVSDSADAVSASINEVLNKGLPDVRSNRTAAGGYNSTTAKLLTDNVSVKAAEAGAKIRQDTIGQYADITQKGADLVRLLVGLSQEGKTTFQQSNTQDTNQRESGTSTTVGDKYVGEKTGGTNYGVGRNQGTDRGAGLDSTIKLASLLGL